MAIIKARFFYILFFILISALISGFLFQINKQVDTIFIGNILTMADSQPAVTALAIRNGEIVAMGSEEEVMHYRQWRTKVVYLGEQTLLPGFIAAHEHPSISAVFRNLVDLSALTHESAEVAKAKFIEHVRSAKPGEWIYGMGIDPILMPELVMLRDELDEIAPDNPVLLISQFLHTFWVNSQALEEQGISENTLPSGLESFYDRYPNGRLNGTIHESIAADPFVQPLRSPLPVINKLREQLKEYKDEGFTTVASLGYNAPPMLAKWVAYNWSGPMIRQVLYLTQNELDYLPSSPENGNDFFRIAGVKLWYDGSPYSGTMYLEEPYKHPILGIPLQLSHDECGHALLSREEFTRLFSTYDSQGWQIAIHSQGDAATNEVVEYIKSLPTVNRNARHRIEHGLLIPTEVLPDLHALNMSVSFHINHILYYGNALEQHLIGEERADSMLSVKSALSNDLRVSLHADSPMFPADPFSLMQTSMIREDKNGQVYGADQALQAMEALRSMTIDAAWQLGMEDQIGSIEVGKQADFVVLSNNPLEQEPTRWTELAVNQVWLSGRRVK